MALHPETFLPPPPPPAKLAPRCVRVAYEVPGPVLISYVQLTIPSMHAIDFVMWMLAAHHIYTQTHTHLCQLVVPKSPTTRTAKQMPSLSASHEAETRPCLPRLVVQLRCPRRDESHQPVQPCRFQTSGPACPSGAPPGPPTCQDATENASNRTCCCRRRVGS